jgi:hypothetical protein
MQSTTNYGLNKPESTDMYNVNDFNENMDKIDKTLAIKPENVSELFNFNKYNGDINSLAVGMYAYHTGSTYTDNGSTVSNGGYGGWGKLLSIDTTTGYCNISSEGFFAMNSNITTRWVKAENFDFILTSTEAEYIGELVSIWGANNGGLEADYAEKANLSTRQNSPSFTIPKNGSSMLITAFRYGSAQMASWVFMSDGPSGSVLYKELFNDGLSLSVSGNTGTISNDGITIRAIYF